MDSNQERPQQPFKNYILKKHGLPNKMKVTQNQATTQKLLIPDTAQQLKTIMDVRVKVLIHMKVLYNQTAVMTATMTPRTPC